MKTSSRVGRATFTDLIGTANSANSRGTNCSPPSTANVTAPSATVALEPELPLQRGDRRALSSVWICDAVLADAGLQRLGRVQRDDVPWSMMAMRSQYSASSM